jgi:hypothetical protein
MNHGVSFVIGRYEISLVLRKEKPTCVLMLKVKKIKLGKPLIINFRKKSKRTFNKNLIDN